MPVSQMFSVYSCNTIDMGKVKVMNIALIFAGGSGKRMHAKDRPKQFLLVHGKPIIVHTIEIFQKSPEIDGIIVVSISDWIEYMEDMKFRYRLDKIGCIVPGGETGQLSIYNGIKAAANIYGTKDNIILIHDGVRPLVDFDLIERVVCGVKTNGSAITCAPATETIAVVGDDDKIENVLDRSRSWIAKAPQAFWLEEILENQERAIADGYINMIDSASLMRHYGKELYLVEGSNRNIKVTTPEDFFMFRAIYDAKENEQLF